MNSNHSTPRRPLQRILAGTCALALGASLAACSASKESIDAAKPKDGDTVKAVATTSMYDMSRVMARGYYDSLTDEQRAEGLAQMSRQRWTDAQNGVPGMGGGLPDSLDGIDNPFDTEVEVRKLKLLLESLI